MADPKIWVWKGSTIWNLIGCSIPTSKQQFFWGVGKCQRGTANMFPNLCCWELSRRNVGSLIVVVWDLRKIMHFVALFSHQSLSTRLPFACFALPSWPWNVPNKTGVSQTTIVGDSKAGFLTKKKRCRHLHCRHLRVEFSPLENEQLSLRTFKSWVFKVFLVCIWYIYVYLY